MKPKRMFGKSLEGRGKSSNKASVHVSVFFYYFILVNCEMVRNDRTVLYLLCLIIRYSSSRWNCKIIDYICKLTIVIMKVKSNARHYCVSGGTVTAVLM